MQITRKGISYQLAGELPQVGNKVPDFKLQDQTDQVWVPADFLGKPTILSVIPDINTRVCALQTKKFNEKASQLTAINFATISNNTKEEQSVWCGQEGVSMLMLHDPQNTFGKSYGLMIPELGYFARALFVIDQAGVLSYMEIVPELSHEPNYQKVLEQAQALV